MTMHYAGTLYSSFYQTMKNSRVKLQVTSYVVPLEKCEKNNVIFLMF